MKYYSALKKQKILVHATARINFNSIIVNEKPDVKDYIRHDSIYMKCPGKVSLKSES